MTQYQKILELHKDGGFVCGNAYRKAYIFSSHKRRSEMRKLYGKVFNWRPCEHGSRNVRDYFMIDDPEKRITLPPAYLPQKRVEARQRLL